MIDFLNSINWEFIIAILAIMISIYSIYIQRKQNSLTFKPIPVIVKYNYSEYISVKIWNKGTGPLIINSLEMNGYNNLIDGIDTDVRKLKFTEYINNFDKRVISPDDFLNILEFRIKTNKSGLPSEKYRKALSKIKKYLNNRVVTIEYIDIYNKSMSYTSKPLNFDDAKDEL